MPPVLKKIDFRPFDPFPFFKSGHTQTILSQFFSSIPTIKNNIKNNINHYVTLPDKDTIVLAETPPKNSSNRIALLVHGLTGSQDSSYMKRGAYYLSQAGYRVFRMNLRGCGPGLYHAKKLYHSGQSQDAQEVLNWISKQHPFSPITLIGFSLGANLSLKLAGELGKKLHPVSSNLDSVIAVSPPLNLAASVKLLSHKKNKFFNQYFLSRLRQDMQKKRKLIADLPNLSRLKIETLLDFDNQVTGPCNGFKNAQDYYQQCSSAPYIKSITLPTLILHAEDDPFIANADFYRLEKTSNLDLLITKSGGHLSWIGKTDQAFNFRWMDRVILKWINWLDAQNSKSF